MLRLKHAIPVMSVNGHIVITDAVIIIPIHGHQTPKETMYAIPDMHGMKMKIMTVPVLMDHGHGIYHITSVAII